MNMGLKNKRQTSKNKNFGQAFGYAWDGLTTLCCNERNFRFHLVTTAVVLTAGLTMRVGYFKFLWLVLACYLVLQAEVINTLAEYLVDLTIGSQYNDLAKKIKDIAAGWVLFSTMLAIVIGLIVFGTTIIKLI
ncbi:diacylglycerol kinase family protein [Fructilactobacillus sanfranciscensis]|uniref:diacylglycerol kinase family protein n=1 Tax=Fructilactobacillus sanfranciscensis TaxID=1625 RepID=UPI001EF000AA|nr:diacylglycerol kinase family protein [Fructilactobacillus sanfranciscensis]MCG7195652.1 diacylglycerol kinase family protein [Fructilactobacillus sanfranciscensis]